LFYLSPERRRLAALFVTWPKLSRLRRLA